MPLTYEEIQARQQARQQQKVEEEKQRNPSVSPEVIEYLGQLEKIEKEGVNHVANVASIGVELAGGVGGMYALDKVHKADKFGKLLKGAQVTRAASLAGFAGPQALEPVSTGLGVLGFMGSSALIWGGSNYIAQNVRKAYGLQDEISSGELIATSVFGGLVPPVGKALGAIGKTGADKQLLKLTGQTAKDFGAYKKGAYITINGVKSFASGAALAMSETAVRQELQIALNERENRETYEYIFAGGFGGTFNSILGVWAKTGWWGRRQRAEVTSNAKQNIAKQVVNLKSQLKELEASDDFVFRKTSKIRKLKDKISETQQAFDIVDDASKTYAKQDDAAEKIDTGKTRKTFEDKVETKIGAKITPEEKPFVIKEIEDLKERRRRIAAEESRALDKGEDSLKPILEPRLKSDATDLAEELDEELSNELADFIVKEKASKKTPAKKASIEDYWEGLNAHLEETKGWNIKPHTNELTGAKRYQIFNKETGEVIGEIDRKIDKDSLILEHIGAAVVGGKRVKGQGIVDNVYAYDAKFRKENNLGIKSDVSNPITLKKIEKFHDDIPTSKKEGDSIDDGIFIEKKTLTNKESTKVTLKKIKQILVNQAELYEKVIAPIDATAGRNLQSTSKRRGEFYNYALDSASATKRKEALDDLLFAIDTKLNNPTFEGVTGDTFKKIFDDLDINIEQIRKVNEDIARAVKSKSKEPKIQKLNKTDNKSTIEKLEKELEELRTKRVDTKEPKNISRNTAPRERTLKEQIKFYKQADKEIKAIVKLEEELEEILKLSPEDFKKLDTEKRVKKELLTKQQAEAKSSKLKKKIEEAKTRLRKQSKKAEKQLKDTEEFEFYARLENYIFNQMDQTMGSSTRRLIATVTSSRQLSLLSVGSAAAGIPTGAFGITKQFVKPHTTFLRNLFSEKRGLPLSYKLYAGDLSSAFAVFGDLSGMLKASYLSAKRLESVTDPKQATRLMGGGATISSTPTGTSRTFRQTRISAGRRAGAKRNLINLFDDAFAVGKFMNIISGPLRLIIGADEAFRRQLYRQVTTEVARKKAILQDHFESNPKRNVMDIEKDLMETAWKKNADGIDVVQETDDFVTALNFKRQEMFYASSGDSVEDVYMSIVERTVQKLQKWLGKRPEANFVLRIFVPFVDVTVRSVVRGARISTGPLLPAYYKVFDNPYVKQLKKLNKKIDEYEDTKKGFMSKEDNKDLVASATKDIDEEILKIKDRLEKLEYRKTEFNEEILADGMMGSSLMGMGFAGGMMTDENGNPLVTGGLAFLSYEERQKQEKRGIKPFTAFGINYRSAAPLMMPVALMADLAAYFRFKDQRIVDEDVSGLNFLTSSFRMMVEELPFNSGLKMLGDLFPNDGTEAENDKATRAWSRLLGSYAGIATPADVDKIRKHLTMKNKKPDFRKADFSELFMHDAFGSPSVNFKRDILGRPEKYEQTFLQKMTRYAPSNPAVITNLDDVISLDVNNILGSKTRERFRNVKMLDFRSRKTRLNLHNEFGNRLMKEKIGRKKLEAAVNSLIRSKRWKKKFNNGSLSINESGKETNLALEELNSLIDDYYDKVQEDILNESKAFKRSFINKDGETLLDVLNKGKKKGQVTRKVKPFKDYK